MDEEPISGRTVAFAIGCGVAVLLLLAALAHVLNDDDAAATTPPTTPAVVRPVGAGQATTAVAPTTPATSPGAAAPGDGSAAAGLRPAARYAERTTTPAEAQRNAILVFELVSACEREAGDFLDCDSDGELGRPLVVLAAGSLMPGEVSIVAVPEHVAVMAADLDRRLWRVSSSAGGVNIERACVQPNGVTPCAVPNW